MIFGISALLVVGASWCLVGIILGRAPKEGFDTGVIQLGNSIIAISVGAVIYQFLPHGHCSPRVILWTCGAYFFSGVFNYYGLQAMAKGMQRGPNGIVWCIMQSALIFSFLGGIIFFGERLIFLRGFGILFLVSALIFFGLAKDNSLPDGDRRWRAWAFFSLALISIQQNINNAPSFFEESRCISSVLRSVCVASGVCLAAFLGLTVRLALDRELGARVANSLKRPLMWLFIALPLFFSLIFSYTLLFPGMDAMAKAGAGSINYPLMVGSCIVSFTLYSRFILREKMKTMQVVALFLCVLGLACLCVPAPKENSSSQSRRSDELRFCEIHVAECRDY